MMVEFNFNVEELLKDELVLTKIDVGRRQLNTAVRMFFFEEDVVSLHTVAAAAHGVLRDVARYKGINKSVNYHRPCRWPYKRRQLLTMSFAVVLP